MVRKNLVLAIVLLIGLVFSTCGGKPTPDVQAIETQTAAKIYATQTASALTQTATPQPTATSELNNSIPSTIAPTPSQPTLLTSLGEFESSQFCRVYHCRSGDSWKLKSGGTDHTYDTSIDAEVTVDIVTIDDRPVSFGLSYFDRDNLRQDDLQYIFLFLEAVHPGVPIDDGVKSYVQQNVQHDLFQICDASPWPFGLLTIWAGKVLQPVISVGVSCSR